MSPDRKPDWKILAETSGKVTVKTLRVGLTVALLTLTFGPPLLDESSEPWPDLDQPPKTKSLDPISFLDSEFFQKLLEGLRYYHADGSTSFSQ